MTLPFGTVTQAEPFQYCTSKSRMPSPVAGVVRSGWPAVVQLFCNVKTSISSIALLAGKSTSSESGYTPRVPSFQPPVPLPQLLPVRSPSSAEAAGHLLSLALLEATAVDPFAANATLDRVQGALFRLLMTRLSMYQPASTPLAVATSDVMRKRM